jgi:hypothetical protein
MAEMATEEAQGSEASREDARPFPKSCRLAAISAESPLGPSNRKTTIASPYCD